MPNLFKGLHTGPIDHQSTSVINAISNTEMDMGVVVSLVVALPPADELLPRVRAGGGAGSPLVYGIVVGGDTDGIYGNGTISTDDTTRAASGAGQAVKIVTQGRCPAKVRGATTAQVDTQINIGDPLTHGTGVGGGKLELAVSGQNVIARALNIVSSGANVVIAVDVKREGPL